MEELKITKEKVLKAASKCETAKATLKVLFPEAFEDENKIKVIKTDHEVTDMHDSVVVHDGNGNNGYGAWLVAVEGGKITLSHHYYFWRLDSDASGSIYLTPSKKS